MSRIAFWRFSIADSNQNENSKTTERDVRSTRSESDHDRLWIEGYPPCFLDAALDLILQGEDFCGGGSATIDDG